MTDARGARATYSYNNRHLVTSINYSAPAGITPTSNVTFGYDAAGNRISMTDGLGSQSYSYNQLSQLTSETRNFADPVSPFLNASYSMSYSYNLAGELKTITDPWGATINYGFDATGRLNNITGSGYGSVTQFDSNMKYRAWGTLKSETYGNGFTQSASYNSRLQMTSFQVRKPSTELQMSTTTQFYADGQVKFSDNVLDERFDRSFAYDHEARTKEAFSGSEARDFINGTSSGTPTGPYRQSYQFSQFNQITQQTNRLWSDTQTTTSTYTNNRRQGWSYDAAGFVAVADGTTYTRDAAGRNVDVDDGASHGVYSFDGDGRQRKTVVTRPAATLHGTITLTTYYLTSSVLRGLVVAEVLSNGQRKTGNIYAGNRKVAKILFDGTVQWSHEEPLTGSRGDSTTSGSYMPLAELNADGMNVGFAEPEETAFEAADPLEPWGALGLGTSCSGSNPNCVKCYVDWFERDCGHLMQLAQAGALQIELQNRLGEKKPVDVDVVLGQLGYWKWDETHHREQPPESPDEIIRVNNQGRYIWQYMAAFFPQNPQQVLPPSKPISDLVRDRMKNPKCAKYLQQLLDKANELFGQGYPHANSMEELLQKIDKAGGFQLDGATYHTVSGDLFANGAKPGTVHIIPFITLGAPNRYHLRQRDDYYAGAGIHEPFHLARQGGYSDRQMAETAYALAGETLPSIPKTGDLTESYKWSQLFDTKLQDKCPPASK